MNIKVRSKQFELEYLLRLLRKYWLLILVITALGCFSGICFNEFSTPLYKSKISVFTWNRGIAEALREIQKDQKDNKRTKSQEIMMYNSIISQSVYLGQRLISDYKNLLSNPEVKNACNAALIKQGFKPPLDYSFKCVIKRKSCIMVLEVVSANKKLATAAANSLVKAFVNEQERLMDIKYTKLIHAATIPINPFFPPKRIILVIGLLLGLTLGLSIAYIWDHFDMTVKGPDDLKIFDLLPLGITQYYRDIDKLCSPEEVSETKRQANSILDSIRITTTTISFLKIDNPPKVLEVTSPLAGSGKSTQVMLLAKVMGKENKKVLIIDCDLRRPRIYKNIKLTDYCGLVNCLTDTPQLSLSKYIKKEVFTSVDLMPHGIIPPNPTELLASKKFTDLIEKLRSKYDCILIDSPPCSGMADAMIIGKNADAIILVTEAGKTKLQHLSKTLEQLESLRDKIIGAIINKINLKKSSGYYYNYGYYYNSQTDQENTTPANE